MDETAIAYRVYMEDCTADNGVTSRGWITNWMSENDIEGYTVTLADGVYEGVMEESIIVEIIVNLGPTHSTTREKIMRFAHEYRVAWRQDCVLVTTTVISTILVNS